MTKILKSALVALLVTFCCTMKAQTIKYTTDNFTYSLNTENQEASLDKYSGDAKEVVIPETVTYEEKEYKVTSLAYYCFDNCSSLTSIEIPSSVTKLGGLCFNNCTSLTSIKIPSSVISLGWSCFYGCSSLESIMVDAANPKYDSREGCNAIIETESNTMIVGFKSTRIPSSVTSLGDGCFQCSFLTSIEIPASVTSLGDRCFVGCQSLTSIEIPASVTSVGKDCFNNCSSLTSIEIPASVTNLEHRFDNCKSLESIVIDVNNPQYDSREGCNAIIKTESNTMILGCKNTRIPESVTSLGDYCFAYSPSLTSIKIPASVTSLRNDCFWGCESLESIVVDVNHPVYDSRENCNTIIETKSNTMILGCKNTRIPESVTSLGRNIFNGRTSPTSIEIPASVTSVEDFCFSNCPSLESIVVDSNNPVYDSRENCNAIIKTESNTMVAGCKNTQISASVTSLGDCCFEGCTSLTEIEIPASVTSLGKGCFNGCSSLTAIEIPASVTSLGDVCFGGCESLTSIEIPTSVTSLGKGCFYDCYSLTSVVSKIEEPFEITESLSPFDDIFKDIYVGCTLTVPYGTKDAYKAAGWNIFFNNIVEEGVVELDEYSWKAPIAKENVMVRMKRSIKADEWSTIVLPFNMTEEQVKEVFGDDAQLADFAGYEVMGDAGDVTCIQVNFNATTSIKANTPCLIKVGMDISEFTVEGVDVVPEEKPLVEAVPSTESQWSKMVGSYVAGTQVEKNCLFLSGNKF
ncbi:MAG: leucine-rich repeat domain-containing protein [Bacteroidaceae bacterium]|nr:leucine-rich repeat domain-containing protein [Bacteroidaceae bacterium]